MGMTGDELYAQAARRLRSEFANLRCIGHPTTKGGAAEALVRDFLDKHLPRRYATGSGFIVDLSDRVSRQTDVIVYDALNCPVYRSSEQAGIFPNDNVAAVIEVKARLGVDTK